MRKNKELRPQVIKGIKDLSNSILRGYADEAPWCEITILAFPKKATKKEIKRYLKRHNIVSWRDSSLGVIPGTLYEEDVILRKNHVYIMQFYDC